MIRNCLVKGSVLSLFVLLVGLTVAVSSFAVPRPPRRVVLRRRAIRRAFPPPPLHPAVVAHRRAVLLKRIGTSTVVVRGGEVCRRYDQPVVVKTPEDLEEIPTVDLSGAAAYKVLAVNDDCTLSVEVDGRPMTVRLIGVVTDVATGEGEQPGRVALQALKQMLEGEFVYLQFDTDYVQQDADGVKMAYVRRAPDGLLVNLELLRLGCAVADTDYVYSYQDVFSFYESKARADAKGIWKDVSASGDGQANCDSAAQMPTTQPSRTQ